MSLDSELDILISQSRGDHNLSEKLNTVLKKISAEQKSKNYKFMRCVLFPEFSKGARFPGPFSMESGIYNIRSEYTITSNIDSRAFGICVKPHANSVTEPLLYNFPDANMDDWNRGVSVNPYSSNENNPLFPPEIFFSRSRLIGCSVIVECISQDVSGRLKGGIEYDVNTEFYSSNVNSESDVYQMMYNSAIETSYFYTARALGFLGKEINQSTEKVDIDDVSKGLENAIGKDRNEANTVKDILTHLTTKMDLGADRPNMTYYAQEIFNGLTTYNLHERMQKGWRNWFKTSNAESTFDYYTIYATLKHLISTIFSDMSTRITTKKLIDKLAAILYPYYENVTSDYVEFKARSAMRLYTNVIKVLDSDLIRGSPLNYNRLQMLSHRNEVPFDEGIRVVYVPRHIHTISYDNHPNDLIFIGGMQLPKETALRIIVTRHFEGVPHRGMNMIYPSLEQTEDENTVKLLQSIIKKNPTLLKIAPRNLAATYRLVKNKFKWVDITLREDGTGFETVKDYTGITEEMS